MTGVIYEIPGYTCPKPMPVVLSLVYDGGRTYLEANGKLVFCFEPDGTIRRVKSVQGSGLKVGADNKVVVT